MGGVVYPETYVDAGKFKGIDARGIGVVVRPRVVGQDFCEGLALVRRQLPLHGFGDADGEWRLLRRFLGKAVQRVGVGVGERQVGLDVEGNDIQRRMSFKENKIDNNLWNISDVKYYFCFS